MDRDKLSELVSINYKPIKRAAASLTKDSDDLIHETYLIIDKRGNNLPEENEQFIKVFVSLMRYILISDRCGFKQLIKPKEVRLGDLSFFFDIESELSDKITKEIMLAEIVRFKQTLNSLELVLFELHYEKGLGFTEIVKLYSGNEYEMSFNCLWKMYTPLKTKLKKFKWKL